MGNSHALAGLSLFSSAGTNNTMTVHAVASTRETLSESYRGVLMRSDLLALMVRALTVPMARMITLCSLSGQKRWCIPTVHGWSYGTSFHSYGLVISEIQPHVMWDSFSGMTLYSGLVSSQNVRHIFSSIQMVLLNESLLLNLTLIEFQILLSGKIGNSTYSLDDDSNYAPITANHLVTMMRVETGLAVSAWYLRTYWAMDFRRQMSNGVKWIGR
jgi:hypothetical protein